MLLLISNTHKCQLLPVFTLFSPFFSCSSYNKQQKYSLDRHWKQSYRRSNCPILTRANESEWRIVCVYVNEIRCTNLLVGPASFELYNFWLIWDTRFHFNWFSYGFLVLERGVYLCTLRQSLSLGFFTVVFTALSNLIDSVFSLVSPQQLHIHMQRSMWNTLGCCCCCC